MKHVFFNIFKILLLIIITAVFVYLIFFTDLKTKLIRDKKSVSDINEPVYILNDLISSYEDYLNSKKNELEIETKLFLDKKNITIQIEEKRNIDKKLIELQKQKKNIQNEIIKNSNDRNELEIKIIKLKIEDVGYEKIYADLNEKYQDIIDQMYISDEYWNKYTADLKAFFLNYYTSDKLKSGKIENEFKKDNGVKFIKDEYKYLTGMNNSAESDKDINIDKDKNEEENVKKNSKMTDDKKEKIKKREEQKSKSKEVNNEKNNVLNFTDNFDNLKPGDMPKGWYFNQSDPDLYAGIVDSSEIKAHSHPNCLKLYDSSGIASVIIIKDIGHHDYGQLKFYIYLKKNDRIYFYINDKKGNKLINIFLKFDGIILVKKKDGSRFNAGSFIFNEWNEFIVKYDRIRGYYILLCNGTALGKFEMISDGSPSAISFQGGVTVADNLSPFKNVTAYIDSIQFKTDEIKIIP